MSAAAPTCCRSLAGSRAGASAGMIVKEDDAGSPADDRLREDLARFDVGAVDGPASRLDVGDPAVVDVEQDGTEDLLIDPGIAEEEVAGDGGRNGQDFARGDVGVSDPAGELAREKKGPGGARAEAEGAEMGGREDREAGEVAGMLEGSGGQLSAAGTEEPAENLDVGERGERVEGIRGRRAGPREERHGGCVVVGRGKCRHGLEP